MYFFYIIKTAIFKHFEAVDVPEHFPELFQLVVWHLGADGLQPLRHEALPQWLADDIVRYQTQDPVQAFLQLGHCAARLVPVSSHLGETVCTARLRLNTAERVQMVTCPP